MRAGDLLSLYQTEGGRTGLAAAMALEDDKRIEAVAAYLKRMGREEDLSDVVAKLDLDLDPTGEFESLRANPELGLPRFHIDYRPGLTLTSVKEQAEMWWNAEVVKFRRDAAATERRGREITRPMRAAYHWCERELPERTAGRPRTSFAELARRWEEMTASWSEGKQRPPPVSSPVWDAYDEWRSARSPQVEALADDDVRTEVDRWSGVARNRER